ncbi:MAG: DUF6152 family protein [Vicinamibacterales bacterium]
MSGTFTRWFVASVLAVAVAPLSAHHGWAGYQTAEFDLEGTVVTGVTFNGAHAAMQIRANDQVWDITLAPPRQTSRAGLTEGVIPVGATVRVHGHRHVDAKRFEVKTERVTWNGKTFNVYPDRT